MSVTSSLARYALDETVLRLDLGKQRLLIKPDDPLPKFYPRPKAVMVIPIYEDSDVLLGPTVVARQSDGGHAYNQPQSYPQQRRQQQLQQKPVRPSRKLRRRHSSYSPPPSSREGSQTEQESRMNDDNEHNRPRPGAGGRQSSRNRYDDRYPEGRHSESPSRRYPQQQQQAQYPPQQQPHYKPGGSSNRPSHQPQRSDDQRYGNEESFNRRPSTDAESSAVEAPTRKGHHENFLQELKAKHDAFHEAIRAYFKIIPPHPDWKRSTCMGKKRAVCIGINYIGQKNELKGCANDARSMRDFLIQQYGFSASNIILLTDDDRRNKLPTRAEMFKAFEWLVNGAQKDDSLFVHYSGHGGQVDDAPGGREIDGKDEDIFPVDFKDAGDIIDNELHRRLVDTLPAGCRLTALFDSCHSGTVLDLPYIHSAHGRLRGVGHVSKRARKRGVADSSDVICFSACKDDESAADTFSGGVAVGAMSYAFVNALDKNKHQTYDELLARLREVLIPKYKQKAQISCTQPLDLERQFTL